MTFADFRGAVSSLLGADSAWKDGEYTIQNYCLKVECTEEGFLILGADGYAAYAKVAAEQHDPLADFHFDDWKAALVYVNQAREKSEFEYNEYKSYLNSAHETCKTLIKIPVTYKHGSCEYLRPCLDVYAANVPDVRLFRVKITSTGYAEIHQPKLDMEDAVDHWFHSARRAPLEAGVHCVAVNDDVVEDDYFISRVIQCEDAVVRRIDFDVAKSSHNLPTETADLYKNVVAPQHYTFLEFTVW